MPYNLENFHPKVKKTIEYRQKLVNKGSQVPFNSSGGRTDTDFHRYTTNKHCQIRMASGVDIVNDNILEQHEIDAGLKLDGMARQFILQGGQLYGKIGQDEERISDDGVPIESDPILSLKRRYGWPSTKLGVAKAYGDILARELADDG